jgi:hypothetical protein
VERPGPQRSVKRIHAIVSDERIEFLELEKAGIRVAQYFTEVPSREVLQKRLHEPMIMARSRLEGGA